MARRSRRWTRAALLCAGLVTATALTLPAAALADPGPPSAPDDPSQSASADTRSATAPGTTDPDATTPDATDPGATDPDATTPDATDPGAADPGAAAPDGSAATDPGATDPAAAGDAAVGADSGAADPDLASASTPELLSRLQSLYQKAEQATETYNGTKEKLDQQQTQYAALSKRLADTRSAVQAARDAAGALARMQYQSGGVSPYVALLLSRDPSEALNQSHILGRAADSEVALMRRLRSGEQALSTTTDQARSALDAVRKLAAQQQQDRDEAKSSLSDVERTVAAVGGTRMTQVDSLEQRDADQAQQALLTSGKLGSLTRTPTGPGARAISYAFAQLGKPYAWGAQGPNAFDCSGLTSQAWQHAGRAIPRTSQEQWARLPRVPLNQLRPGDLVVYFPHATHVALYIGHGLVVQAPHPGARVRVSPIAANPILGAVRPDPATPPVASYALPEPPAVPARPAPRGHGAG
ncbi:C40 family peptidase [Streptomyces sp. ICBB 8177]|uniref:C40 family peptidase n=1 Tax=Streptomyces sp. ICBB 8177 TaxID=563922 RepID=UPI0013053F8D|nr:C40 family peptidase [Streptomyces sp. ICBB 8177]